MSSVKGKGKQQTCCSETIAELKDFTGFFENWISEQGRLLHDLLDVLSCVEQQPRADVDVQEIEFLVQLVLQHYEEYYRAKSVSAETDVLSMFSQKWTSSTEKLFQWVGGWLPSAAFQLFSSRRSLRAVSHIQHLLKGIHVGNLADLSEQQEMQLENLKRKILWRETEISEEVDILKSSIANTSLVSISHKIGAGDEESEAELAEEMKERTDKMKMLLNRADMLRLETLTSIIEVLEPLQAVDFLVAAAELHLKVHEYGMKVDKNADQMEGITSDFSFQGFGSPQN